VPLLLPLRLDALPRRELLRLESEAALSFEVIFEVFNLISTATLACASFLERRASSLSAIVARHTRSSPVQNPSPRVTRCFVHERTKSAAQPTFRPWHYSTVQLGFFPA
jgi:hypothetical protein